MAETKTISLDDAIGEITRACEAAGTGSLAKHPFFFLVGAGISCPPIPLSAEIVESCKKIVKGRGQNIEDSDADDPMLAYSAWFRRAFEQPVDRQRYLQSLIEDGKNISHANFRLAHLLEERKVSNIVVTPNFDDSLARALRLFGKQPLVCDYPEMVMRVDPDEQEKIQIIHVHGTYPYYDCINLSGEIEGRAQSSSDTTSTMGNLLEAILWRRSPIVIGYGGWKNDVIMRALKRRLQKPLAYNVYWFCHSASSIQGLPDWLSRHQNVYFVVSQPKQGIKEFEGIPLERILEDGQVAPPSPSLTTTLSGEEEPLTAVQVFNEINRAFSLEIPGVLADPLGFLLEQLRKDLPQDKDGARDQSQDGPYYFDQVIRKIEEAIQIVQREKEKTEDPFETLRDSVRRSQFKKALLEARALVVDDLTNPQLLELLRIVYSILTVPAQNPEDVLEANSLFLSLGSTLSERPEE